MTILLLVLSLLGVGNAETLPLSRDCELNLGEAFIKSVSRAHARRTLKTHDKQGFAVPAMRLIMDAHFPDVFPEDTLVLNSTPLPRLEIIAELLLPEEKSQHFLMILRLPKGPAAALVHFEKFGHEDGRFLTMPLGASAMLEVREHLLEAYQLPPPKTESPHLVADLSPRPDLLKHLALFADDRVFVDPTKKGGLVMTTFEDILEVVPADPLDRDGWRLNLRRDGRGVTILRTNEELEDKLDVYAAGRSQEAIEAALSRLRAHLDRPEISEKLRVFVGGEAGVEAHFDARIISPGVRPSITLPDDEMTREILAQTPGDVEVDRRATAEGSVLTVLGDGSSVARITVERIRRRLSASN